MEPLTYGIGRAVTKITDEKGKEKVEFTTYRGDIINSIVAHTLCEQAVERGDKITIKIKVRKHDDPPFHIPFGHSHYPLLDFLKSIKEGK